MIQKQPPRLLNRRQVIKKTGSYMLAVPFAGLAACKWEDATDELDDVTSEGVSASSGYSYENAESLDADNSDVAWATGGTAAMTVTYPDPFDDVDLGTACTLTTVLTEGPCYSGTLEREDISEGRNGLPVRLSFLVVDSTCTPVPGAVVDIWHCDPYGVYSGDDMSNVDFCTGGDTEAQAAAWFRGTQTTDTDGRVNFSTCYPGWYTGRAVHIHLKVLINGDTYTISQVGFSDDLNLEILANEPVYQDKGTNGYTYNNSDTVFPNSGYEVYLCDTQKMSDGSMLAWKTFVIPDEPTSDTGSGSGGMGGGGQPPGGGGPGQP